MSTLTKKVGSRQHTITDRVQLNSGNAPQLGFTTVDLGGAFSGNYTLTNIQYNNLVIRVIGTLTGDGYIIVPDDAGAFWTFKNDTTGLFALAVKTSGQSAATAVDIPAGGAADVFEGYVAPNYLVYQKSASGSGGAPVNANYFTFGTDPTLTNERSLVHTANFSTVDGGAGANYTVDLSTTGVTPGTYKNATVTVDGYGRVTVVADGYSGILSFNNIADLRAYNTTGLVEGTYAFVNTLNALFEYSNNAVDAAAYTNDAIEFMSLTSTNGSSPANGRWFRKVATDWRWVTTTNWYIDGISGNNENSGASNAPLKTVAELYRRLGDAHLPQNTTIHIISDLIDNDRVKINPTWTSDGYSLIFRGVPSVTNTYTLTGTTIFSRSGNTPFAVTKATSWGVDDMEQIFKLNDGVNDGYGVSITYGTTDLTVTNAFTYNDILYGTQSTIMSPATGNTLSILSLPIVEFDKISAQKVYIQLLTIRSDIGGIISEAGGEVTVNRCKFIPKLGPEGSVNAGLTASSGGHAYLDNCFVAHIYASSGGYIAAHNAYINYGIFVDDASTFYHDNSATDSEGDLFFNMSHSNVASDAVYSDVTNSIIELANVCLINTSGLTPAASVITLGTGSSLFFRDGAAIYADINTNIDGYLANVYGVRSMLILGDIPNINIYAKFDGSGTNILGEFIHNGVVRWGSTDFPITNLVKFNGVIAKSSS